MVDEQGYVILKNRSKDIIISGGENISSVEDKDVLYRRPAVLVAAVVASPYAKWGEVPCAFVELKEHTNATEAELIGFCRTVLLGFKTPKAVIIGPVPKTSTGKTQKHLNDATREALGSTAAQLIRERTMLEAKRLLLHSDISIAEIAERLNFDDPAYFSRCFKKHTTRSPIEFRKSMAIFDL